MGKTYLKRLTTLIISFGICLSMLTVLNKNDVNAKSEKSSKGPEVTDHFSVIDENGNIEIISFEEASGKNMNIKFRTDRTLSENYVAEAKSGTYYVAHLNSKSWDGKYSYLSYDNASIPGEDGYTTGSYALDGAYLGTYNGKYRVMQAGVLMDFNPKDVNLVEYSNARISYYMIKNGYLTHYYYSGSNTKPNATRVGYRLNYLKENTKYYSYDGHYFYTSYPTMINDYKKNTRINSINSKNPYYNYYQFLSHRTLTSFTESDLNGIVEDKIGDSPSKMKNQGKYYIQHQNTYGINALLMFGVSGNESAWGTSSIAKDKNNLFGHGAVDSNPYYGANGYKTPADSIKYHAEKFISKGYLDNEDWRYKGPHLGDKLSGINVKYASDPYWGEKAASVNYYYNIKNDVDYGKYTIGIINGLVKEYKLYKEPSYSAHVTHTLGKGISPLTYDLPILIMDTVSDSSGKKWYKIQSDTPLNSNRTDTKYDAQYNFGRDYLYIPADNITIINKGDVAVPTYLPGDVNGDGKVSSLDYIQIKNHIMKTKVLSESALLRADVNGDGKVSSLDYIKIKNHIMGTNKLF